MSQSIVFTGGGTGGHVFPGLAVLQELRKSWTGDLCWIGSSRGMERQIMADWAIPYYGIPAGKLRREFSFKNFVDVFRVIGGIVAAYSILRKLKPVALFSKGGYVSVPPVIAAKMLRIPVLTHESDADPGLATRINARFSDVIFVPYEETVGYFDAATARRVVVSGNPVRVDVFSGSAAEGRRIAGAPAGRPILLVLGGSQGARRVNSMVSGALRELTRHYYVVHQTGPANESSEPEEPGTYHPVPFIRGEYGHVLVAADLVVSRAGAGTLWELAVAGKPSILIPLAGSGTRGDQVRNAELFAARGAAMVLGEKADAAELATAVAAIGNDPEKLRRMGEAASAIGNRDAAALIAARILQVAGEAAETKTEGETSA